MHDKPAAAIEDGAQKIESPGDVEITDVHVPVLVGLQGLHEACAFLGGRGRLPGQESCGLEDAIDAGRAARHLVGIEHHEGQPAVAFERMAAGESTDTLFLVIGEPMIARHPGVVLIDFAEAAFPVVVSRFLIIYFTEWPQPAGGGSRLSVFPIGSCHFLLVARHRPAR